MNSAPNFAKVQIEKYDFNQQKGFFKEKFPKFPRFFIISFSRQPKMQKAFCSFLLSYLVCSPIWLNYFLDDHHFDYITKSCYLHNNHLQPPTTSVLYLPTYIGSSYRLCDRKGGGFYKIGYQNGTLITQLWLAMY